MKHFLRQHLGIFITCTAFLSAGSLRLNDLSLYNDSDRYVIWGTAIASGKGFVDFTTPTPERYVVNAPFYSVFLAPAMMAFPSSLLAAKIWTLLAGTLAIGLFYRWLLLFFSRRGAWMLATLFAATPLMLVVSTEALSEAVFISALFYLLSVYERPANEATAKRWSEFIPLVVAALMPLLREIAFAAVLAFCFVFGRKRDWRSLAILLALTTVFVGGWTVRNIYLIGVPASSQDPNVSFIAQHLVTSSNTSLITEVWTRISLNAGQYWNELGGSGLFLFPGSIIVHPGSAFQFITRSLFALQGYLLFIVLPVLALGVYRDARSNLLGAWRLVFGASYLLVALVYPVHDMRFFLPLIPLLLTYLALGTSRLTGFVSLRSGYPHLSRFVAPVIAAAILIPNLLADREVIQTNLRYERDPLAYYRDLKALGSKNEYFTHPWRLVGNLVRQNTPAGTVLGSASKGLATFLEGRKMLEMNSALSRPVFEQMVCENAVEFIIAPTVFDGFHAYDQFVGLTHRIALNRIVDFGSIRVWSVSQGQNAKPAASPPDSSAATSVRLGFEAMTEDDLETANRYFSQADQRRSSNAAIRFYQLVATSLGDDTQRAERLLQELFELPQSTSYQLAAKQYIETQRRTLNALNIADPALRAVQLLQTARFYWDVGFQQRAMKVVNRSVESDGAFFEGLLWQFYFAHQLNDMRGADRTLKRLTAIDAANPVVKAFTNIRTLERSDKNETKRGPSAAQKLAIANEWRTIELFDAALETAEQAAEIPSPSQSDALVFLAGTYSSLGKPRAALRAYERALHIDPRLPVGAVIDSLNHVLAE